jgi:hypothetical protein
MPYVTSIERRAIRQGLLEGIELGLELKFGNEGLEVMPEVSRIEDIEVLKSVRDSIKRITSLQELRLVYQSINHQNI